MAAIWYYKRHARPVPKDSKASIFFNVANEQLTQDIKDTSELLKNEDILSYELVDNSQGLLVEIKLPINDDNIIFTQPFTKEELNYKLSDLDKDGFRINTCASCVHFVNGPFPLTEWTKGFCHLVQGIITGSNHCDMFAEALMMTSEEDKNDNLNQPKLV